MRRRWTARDRVGVMGMTIAGAMTAMKAAGVNAVTSVAMAVAVMATATIGDVDGKCRDDVRVAKASASQRR